jgi:hypothetical protein
MASVSESFAALFFSMTVKAASKVSRVGSNFLNSFSFFQKASSNQKASSKNIQVLSADCPPAFRR